MSWFKKYNKGLLSLFLGLNQEQFFSLAILWRKLKKKKNNTHRKGRKDQAVAMKYCDKIPVSEKMENRDTGRFFFFLIPGDSSILLNLT